MVVFLKLVLRDPDRSCSLDMGAKIQEVSVVSFYFQTPLLTTSIDSIIRGPWDVAVPKVN